MAVSHYDLGYIIQLYLFLVVTLGSLVSMNHRGHFSVLRGDERGQLSTQSGKVRVLSGWQGAEASERKHLLSGDPALSLPGAASPSPVPKVTSSLVATSQDYFRGKIL